MRSLVIIFAISWLLVLAGAGAIFNFIVPYNFCSCTYNNFYKAALTTVLCVAWLLAMVIMRNTFVRKNILVSEPETTQSTASG